LITRKKRQNTAFCRDFSRLDEKLKKLEKERVLLLSIRNSVMKEASKTIRKIENVDARRLLYLAVDEHDKRVKRISQALNQREEKIRQI
jgi:hypothetical protein